MTTKVMRSVDDAQADFDTITAAEVPFTPAGTIAATDVQAAIEEVAAEAGAVVQTREFFGGSAVLMPGDETLRYLPWAHVVGDTLLDLTDPLHPTIIDAGTYAFTVNIVGPNGPSAIYDITAWCFIGLDVANGDAYQDNQFPIASLVGAVAPIYSQALTHYCAAGSEVVTHVRHAYGTSLNFAISQANVQRLS